MKFGSRKKFYLRNKKHKVSCIVLSNNKKYLYLSRGLSADRIKYKYINELLYLSRHSTYGMYCRTNTYFEITVTENQASKADMIFLGQLVSDYRLDSQTIILLPMYSRAYSILLTWLRAYSVNNVDNDQIQNVQNRQTYLRLPTTYLFALSSFNFHTFKTWWNSEDQPSCSLCLPCIFI